MPTIQRYWETIPRSKERAEEIRAFRRQAMSRTLRHETKLTNETQERKGVARKQLGAFFGDMARERSGITPQRALGDRAPILNLRTSTLERESDRPATGRPTPPKRVLDALEMTGTRLTSLTPVEAQDAEFRIRVHAHAVLRSFLHVAVKTVLGFKQQRRPQSRFE